MKEQPSGGRLRIDGIVFDMDGTLVDSTSRVADAYLECVAAMSGRQCSYDEIFDAYRLGPAEAILTHLLRRPHTDGDLTYFHARLAERTQGLTPYPGVPEMLRAVSKRVPVALFSGASFDSCTITLRAAGLPEFFEVIVTGDDIIEPKPHPHGILLACERLGVPPRSAAYVGDTANDVRAARSAGTVAIIAAWNSNASTADADRVLREPSELLGLVS